MVDLLNKFFPKPGSLFRVINDNGFIVLSNKNANSLKTINIPKDEIVLLIDIVNGSYSTSFSIDYKSPANWVCTFLYKGDYVLGIFHNKEHQGWAIFDYLELVQEV